MDFKDASEKLISVLSKYKSVLIYIKGSPDPDVIASSYALKLICQYAGIKAAIAGSAKPSLPQNAAIINELDIPVQFEFSFDDQLNYDAYAVLDFQSAYVDGITGKIPCAVHIDHHEPVEEDIEIDFKLVLDELGSLSSFFGLIIRELLSLPGKQGALPRDENIEKLDDSQLRKVSTALEYGIYSDTDAYRHAGYLDFEALGFISNYSDQKIIDHITKIPLPKHVLGLMIRAFESREEYKNWIFAGIGFIDESARDSIAVIADFLVQRFKNQVVVVFGAVVRKKPHGLRLDASFRTEDKDIDLDALAKEITQSGGGRKYKGAYQVDLNYFADCTDKDLVWKAIECATIAKLKRLRDEFQIIEIKGLYKKIKKKAEEMFKF